MDSRIHRLHMEIGVFKTALPSRPDQFNSGTPTVGSIDRVESPLPRPPPFPQLQQQDASAGLPMRPSMPRAPPGMQAQQPQPGPCVKGQSPSDGQAYQAEAAHPLPVNKAPMSYSVFQPPAEETDDPGKIPRKGTESLDEFHGASDKPDIQARTRAHCRTLCDCQLRVVDHVGLCAQAGPPCYKI